MALDRSETARQAVPAIQRRGDEGESIVEAASYLGGEMMTTIELLPTPFYTDVIAENPVECPRCERSAYWFRNQDGQTCCIQCAKEGSYVQS